MDNIQKLREKVEKDPRSTVFVRLAEELKKAGQLDEAVEVLQSGIERQPGYMSARVALGKIYMDKEMPDEAKTEFMQVVEAVPDNLFARKKLAELYRAEDDIELAIKHYKKYIALSPQDEEALTIYNELRNNPAPQAKATKEEGGEEEPADVGKQPSPLKAAAEQEARPSGIPEGAVAEEKDIDAEDVYLETSPHEEDVAEGFLSALSDQEAEEGGEEEPSLSLQEKDEDTSGHGVAFTGFDIEGGGTPDVMGQDDIDSMIEEVAGVPEEPATAGTEAVPEEQPLTTPEEATFNAFEEESSAVLEAEPAVAPEAMEFEGIAGEEAEEETDEPMGVVELSEEEAGIELELEGVPMGGEEETDIGVVEISEEDSGVELEGFIEAEPESEELIEPMAEVAATPPPVQETAPAMSPDEQFAEADALVEQEEYGKALEIYRRLLAHDADNAEARQRADELRGLIKLLGKDREIVEARLLAFLESLQRKKHEFFGSS